MTDKQDDARAAGMLKIYKDAFLDGLRKAPSRAFNDNKQLLALCKEYNDKLGGCYDRVDYGLEKFSIHMSMSFDRLIETVISGQ